MQSGTETSKELSGFTAGTDKLEIIGLSLFSYQGKSGAPSLKSTDLNKKRIRPYGF